MLCQPLKVDGYLYIIEPRSFLLKSYYTLIYLFVFSDLLVLVSKFTTPGTLPLPLPPEELRSRALQRASEPSS